jgi:hypothetical protein
MRFVASQCKVCPFRRTSAPGWLGSYDAGSVFRSIWKGVPFFCHSAINYERKDWEERAMASGKLCTGGLVFAKKICAPDREIQHEPIRVARLKVLAVEHKIECMDAKEFQAHHTRGWLNELE